MISEFLVFAVVGRRALASFLQAGKVGITHVSPKGLCTHF